MQRRHAASGGCIGISTHLDEIVDGVSLACGVPACGVAGADQRRVWRLGAPPVSGPNVRAEGDQVSCHLGVVTEPRSLQRGVAFVDLGETLGNEELVAFVPTRPSPTTVSRRAISRLPRGRGSRSLRATL